MDIDPYKLGKRHALDASILGDAGQAAKAILDKVNPVESTPWWRANVKNNQNWRDYMNKLEGKTEGELQLYQVYNAINKYADQDAIYSIDVGDTTQTSTRHLHMTPKNMWRTSPTLRQWVLALPGGIAAKKDNPARQVWNIMGDGAFNMCYPDVITNVQYDLPVINVVLSNGKYAFIKDNTKTNKHLFGCDFSNADYAKIAEAQGAVGFTVDRIEDIDAVVAEAVKSNKEGKTIVIDARITATPSTSSRSTWNWIQNHQKKPSKPSKKNTKQKNSYHSVSSWKKKGCNHAQSNNFPRRKSNMKLVDFIL